MRTSATGTVYRSRSRRRRGQVVAVVIAVATALALGLLAISSSGWSRMSPTSGAGGSPETAAPPAGAAASATGSATGPAVLDDQVEFDLVAVDLEPDTGGKPPPGIPVGDGVDDTPTGQPPEPTPGPTPGPTPTVTLPEPKLVAAPEPTPAPGDIAAPGLPVGCAAGCITKAWLTPSATSTDVKLEVRSDTLARIAVAVGTQPPADGGDDGPQIGDPTTTASTGPEYETVWYTTLTGLAPDTRYHIVVSARDAHGWLSTEAGEFTTPEPASGFAAAEPGGCAANCVKKALISPTPGAPSADLTVTTHVPATMAIYLSQDAPELDDAGQPQVPGPAADTTGGERLTEWGTTLPLGYGTTYHAILRVTDDQSRHQFLQASFATLPEPQASHQNRVQVTFHKIHVSDDADNTFFNRKGELSFYFRVDGEFQAGLRTGEHTVKAPAWVSLDDGDRAPGRDVVVENAPDELLIEVQAHEKDGDRAFHFCTAGIPWFDEVSGRDQLADCYELEWNTASAVVDLHPEPADDPALPPCYGFDGITGDLCVLLRADGADPAFEVYVTIDFLS